MPHFDTFIFESYELHRSNNTISLRYSLDNAIHLEEVLNLPASFSQDAPSPELNAALFALHLAGGASYYKAYLPPTIEVRSGSLTPEQAKFWNTLYTNGLGEFFYRNNIDFRGLIAFPATASSKPPTSTPAKAHPKRILVPFGGGKDSIVSTEALRAAGANQTLFRVRSHPFITELAQTAQLPLIEIERRLDPQLSRLNHEGALNGHVPITAYISFLSIVTALLGDYDAVAFSNERSSSYGNIEYLGMTINHQWSKSLAAEKLIRSYIQNNITQSVAYLNPLRQLSELKIAKLFTEYPQYFNQATSCNRNWTLAATEQSTGRWCGTCPKCAFSFALFAGYLPKSIVIEIFGQNIFDKAELLPLYRELWGEEGFKPFECVGTPDETQAALYLASQTGEYDHTPIMQAFASTILPTLVDPAHTVADLIIGEPQI